ncbi:hypothetical protein HJD18_00150 [Thermoleophilia bacterium SCSIO 60948]|nr:hypothetical protein HJD18_00150 [Thermoleophilia bacterium SCSIO 60948]
MTASIPALLGLLAAAAAAATALLAPSERSRLFAMAAALVLAPLLIVGDMWDGTRLDGVRANPLLAAAALAVVLAAVVGLGLALRRRPLLFCVLLVAALPLRVPIGLGGETSNLLLPLYLVIAAQLVATALDPEGARARALRRDAALMPAAGRWCFRALALSLVVYAALAAYSLDVSNAIENVAFFLVPFAVLAALVVEQPWGRRELSAGLVTVGISAVVFAAIGIAEFAAGGLLLNPALEQSNQIHLYFRVNSLFFDPNVFGRYLALAVVLLGAFLAYGAETSNRERLAAGAAAIVAVVGLVLSYSLTSFLAVGAGLVVVSVLRWRLRGALAALALGAASLAVLVALGGLPNSSMTDRELDTSGRTSLVSGGIELAEARPLGGYGSGSFGRAFYENIREARTTVSHAEPITVAAEQGAVGLMVYAALLVASIAAVWRAGLRSGAGAAVAAAYAAILVHSMGYAGFLIDPVTWVLLALALALALARTHGERPASDPAV